MKATSLLFTFIFLLTAAISTAQDLKIKSDEAKISFYFVSDDTKGTVSGLEATIKFDANNLDAASIEGSVDVSTLSTKNKGRDSHLQSADFFDVGTHKKMSFKSTSVTKTDKGFKMAGKLKIKDIEKDVTFYFTYKEKVFSGRATIYAADFGVSPKKKREDSKVKVKVTIPVE